MLTINLKRVMSFVLSLALICGMLPQTSLFAEAADSEAVVTFDFTPRMINRCETGVAESTKLNPRDITEYFEVGQSEKYSTYSRNWKYFTETLNSAVEMHNTYGTYYDGGSFGSWVAFKVKGLNKGSYKISLGRYDVQKKGCVYGLYILDAEKYTTADSITAALNAPLLEGAQKVGEADTYASNAASITFGSADFIGDKQTEYIVVLRAERAGTVDDGEEQPTNSSGNPVKSYCFIALKSLTFELVEVLDRIEIKDISAVCGEKVEPVILWKSTAGTECEDETIIDTFDITENDGAIVKDNDGNLYAVKPGKAKIKVSGHLSSGLGGKKVSNEATIIVAENTLIFSGEKYDLNFLAKPIITNEKAGSDFSYISGSTNKIDPRSLSDYGLNASGTYTRNWMYFGETLNAVATETTDNNGTYFDGDKTFGDWVAFKVRNIEAGMYKISVEKPSENRKGCVWSLYVLDAERYTTKDAITEAISLMSDGVSKVGEADFYGSSNSSIEFGSVELAGDINSEYLLVFRSVRAGTVDDGESAPLNSAGTVVISSAEFIAIKSITFDGTYTESVDTELTYTELGVGESSEIIATRGLKNTGTLVPDMSQVSFVNYEITDGNDVVKIEEGGKTLLALKTGTATLKTTVIHEGRVITDVDKIEVSDAFAIEELLPFGSPNAYIGNNFRIAPLVKLGDGSEIIPAGVNVSYEIESGSSYVSADGDKLIAGTESGTAMIKMKAKIRGKTFESESFEVTVTDIIESLSGKSYTIDLNNVETENKSGSYAGLKVEIPHPGRYQTTLRANMGKTSGTVEFFAIPYTTDVSANPIGFTYDAFKMFSTDLYSRSSALSDIALPDVVFDVPGEYLILVRICGKNAASIGFDADIESITFDGESVINKVVAEVETPKIGVGETTGFNISAYLSNGTAIPVEDAKIKYVFDERYLSVDTEKKTITTKSDISEAVKTNIMVCVEYKGYVAENNILLNIDKNYGANPDKKALLYGETSVTQGSKISLIPAIELSNRSIVQVYESEIRYEIVENSDGALGFDTDGVTLKAIAFGTATIKAYISFRGNEYESEVVTIHVVENTSVKDLEINFTKGGHIGDGFETLDSAVTYTQNRDWVFYEIVGNDKTQKLKMETAQAQLNFDPDEDDKYLALKIRISGSGTYDVTAFSNKCRSRAGQFDMYIFPATKENLSNISANLLDENYVGYMDFYNETTSSIGVPSEIIDVRKNLDLPIGEYLVVLELVPRAGSTIKDSRGDVVYPTYIHFTDVNSMARAELCVDSQTLDVGAEMAVSTRIFNSNGGEITENPDSVVFRSSDNTVATISADGTVTGVSEGEVEIRANITYGEITKTESVKLHVKDSSKLLGISLSVPKTLYIYGSEQIFALAEMESGKSAKIPEEYITWTISDENIAEISEGRITGKATGALTISATISEEYKSSASTIYIQPATLEITWDSNATPSLFTVEERENAKTNASKYAWARDVVKSAKSKADSYLENFDALYEMIVPEGLPRYYHVGNKYDEAKYNCRYCDYDIGANVNIYGWTVNPIARQWKIQCPGCKRVFPSNNFGAFYKLGVTESGRWNYEKALQKHHELFVCEDTENGNECSHTPPAKSAPKAGSEEWNKNDPRDAEWYEYYGYGVKGGYLNNDLYGEMDKKLGVSGWGVDDGFGYRQPYISDPTLPGYHVTYNDDDGDGYARFVSGTREGPVQHTYIAYYLHEGVWLGAGGLPQSSAVIKNAMTAFKNAFLYTGDPKYGRAGAILLDKIADYFPDYDWYQWKYFRGDNVRGTIVDGVWGTTLTISFVECCDAFLPMYNDKYVLDYLSTNRARYEIDEETGDWKRDENGNLIPVNLKDSPGAIRKNAEEGILLASYRATREGKLYANFGPEQETVGKAAIVINRMPETKEMLDWVFNYGEPYNEGDYKGDVTGGDVLNKVIDDVDRDGNGGENAPQYNMVWVKNLANLADELSGYTLYPTADLFKNPKYVKMLTGQIRQTLGGYYTPQTGDSGYTASRGMYLNLSAMLTAFKHTGNRFLAQAIWKYNKESNGGIVENLHGSLFDTDAEQLMRDIEKIVKEDGEMSLDSDLMAGYGFAALRAGANFTSASSATEKNTNRDFAIYFGASDFHGHAGLLNLYISAFGLNMAPDLGYPASTGVQPNRYQWVRTTLSHNTVVVDESEQLIKGETGMPYHFDDAGRVKVMDVSADVYAHTDDYRRSLIMVDVNDDVSYGVDFFHVRGGNDHLYSFHSQSDEICSIEGLGDVTVQPTHVLEDGTLVGTYAGADVAYGGDPGGNAPNNIYPLGYTWLKNIRTYTSPEPSFAVEFKVKDWNGALRKNADLRLRMTMVSEEPMNEVTFATGEAPQRGENKNVGELEYVLVRNKGKNLDTTFTTVFEPYEAGNKYLKNVSKLPMVRKEGTRPGLYDSFSAVKVEHLNGRIDYVIYSTNTDVEYIITDDLGNADRSDDISIVFCGFAGVMTLEIGENGKPIVAYSYLNDGKTLRLEGEAEKENKHPSAYTGTVCDFTTELAMENSITVTLNNSTGLDLNDISGKYVYIENDGVGNGAYRIESAEECNDVVKLNLGNVSLIRNYLIPTDISAGYVYNISKGQRLRIPMTNVSDNSPIVDPINTTTVLAGSTVTIPFKASSPSGKPIVVLPNGLPRGMSVDSVSGKIIWKPTASQVGENHVALTVSDGTLETTVHFTVIVYGSTAGGTTKPTTPSEPTTPNAPSGGGAGGGGTTAPSTPAEPIEPETPAAGEKFTDISNHAWAADAINALAEEGIIKGTSATTFSPANNITRADFALLLVRAFKLESDSTENFADILADDYFASEVAIARNNGIINGIGDNKFAPRNTITRQDMMTIVYRAMVKLGVELKKTTDAEMPDADAVAEYAEEAVSALIGAGLVNGKSGNIAPNDYTTRAEVAVLLKRILGYTK